jgi:galactokinase
LHDARGAGRVIAERERDVRQAFKGLHGREPDTVWSAPGRANLIGEHTDYNEGFVLPFAIEQRVFVAAARRSDGRVHAHSLQAPTDDGSWLIDDPESTDPAKGWLAYPFGVARALRRHGAVTGVDLVVDGDVPLGAGLASSAALECAVASAMSELSGLDLSGVELGLVGQAAENEHVGVPTGVMDQLAALLCKTDHALFLDTRSLETRQIPFHPAASRCVLLVIDTKSRHALASSGYASRRRDCELAAQRLGVPALRDLEPSDLESADIALHDERLSSRMRHVVTENARVLECVQLLESGGLRDIGPILSASHVSLRDDYEVSCRELDLTVDACDQAGALGARMIGGGFGGSVLVLADADTEEDIRSNAAASFASHGLRAPSVERAVPSAGVLRADLP